MKFSSPRNSTPKPMAEACSGHGLLTTAGICLFLIMACLAVYGQVRFHDFILYDDEDYLVKNQFVQLGLTPKSVKYAFTSTYHGHWHPITWMSHCLDVEIFGSAAGKHHLVNLALHIMAVLACFLAFRRLTHMVWHSAFIAALFALHPLHVETVAWIADRKDLLCGLFWFLTVWAYARYTEQPGFWRYAAVLAGFVLGLLSKSIMVMLPFVLLCLDYWPLNRFSAQAGNDPAVSGKKESFWSGVRLSASYRLVREKVPFFLLLTAPAVFALLTVQITRKLTLNPLNFIPRVAHVSEAMMFFTNYLHKLFIPLGLTLPSPQTHFHELAKWKIIGSLFLLLSISAIVIKWRRKHPFLVTGWLWYLIILFPTSGMLGVLVDKIADRYSYISLTGLFIIITWGAPALLKRWRQKPAVLTVAAMVVLFGLAGLSWNQTRYWKDTISLFRHTLDVNPDDYESRIRLAVGYMRQKRYNDAIDQLKRNIREHPAELKSHHNLGIIYKKLQNYSGAEQVFQKILAIDPNHWQSHNNLGHLALMQEKDDEALYHFLKTVSVRPRMWFSHHIILKLLVKSRRMSDARTHFEEIIPHIPKRAEAYTFFGKTLENAGHLDEAIINYEKALTINSNNPELRIALGIILAKNGRLDQAVHHYQAAIETTPQSVDAHYNLGVALFHQGKIQKARKHFTETLRLSPDFAQAHNNLGIILGRQEEIQDAINHFSQALEIDPEYADASRNLKKAQRMLKLRPFNSD